LVLVGQIAPVIRGTTSRITIYGTQIQPSEFMKIAIIITLAWLFARLSVTRVSLLASGLLVGVAAALIVIEPDIGMAALICLLWGALIIFLGASWRSVSLIILLAAVAFLASWFWLFADYQKDRLSTFIDPGRDPLGAGYNINQSIVAFGSGGLFGRGLGHGPQSQLKFLPERHTDFILASVGEELGFVGISLITGLYTVLLWRVIKVVQATKDPFGQYLAVSIFFILLISFFVSASMNMGLLPVTGIPLPLVSYGGSNLVATMILLGIVQSIKRYSHWLRQPPLELTEIA
jgi:rod shape determining protein RodA